MFGCVKSWGPVLTHRPERAAVPWRARWSLSSSCCWRSRWGCQSGPSCDIWLSVHMWSRLVEFMFKYFKTRAELRNFHWTWFQEDTCDEILPTCSYHRHTLHRLVQWQNMGFLHQLEPFRLQHSDRRRTHVIQSPTTVKTGSLLK